MASRAIKNALGRKASGTAARANRQDKAVAAVKKTLGTVPEVMAVLSATTAEGTCIVTVLSQRSDDAILRVAEQELALMDRMRGLGFDFRTAHVKDMDAYIADGYVPLLEN